MNSEKAFQVMAQDFLQMCPSMRRLAVDETALISRYEGYTAQGLRPTLPSLSFNDDTQKQRQKEQRDKLIELFESVMETRFEHGMHFERVDIQRWNGKADKTDLSSLADKEVADQAAEKAFRDYVEHMHDKPTPDIEIEIDDALNLEVLSIRMDKSLADKLRDFAKRDGVFWMAYIRNALKRHIADVEFCDR